MKVKRIWQALFLSALICLLSGCLKPKVTWINEVNDGEWHGWTRYDPLIFGMQTGPDIEIGFRDDGVVVWREAR